MSRAWWHSLFTFLSIWTALTYADQPPYYRDQDYLDGNRGRYIQQHFKTQPHMVPPRMNFMQEFTKPECDDGAYFFTAPRGNVPNASFYVMDAEGSLVWGPDRRYGEVYNFQVQKYKGEDYLAFWAGDDSIGGHGEGKYYLLDKHYEEHAKISAGDGIRGDLHAFTLTDDDTAIYTGYEIVQKDLTIVGKSQDSWIWESLFQELDIPTGNVLFEWRASEHINFHDMYVNPNKAERYDPWDFFHINMVEKDADGNYLVSTRYGRCALYIDGRTKEILWTLGGKTNSFKDLSNGDATTFMGQHDVHWHDGHNYITLFDNRGDWFHKMEEKSRGKMIKLDLEQMTAKVEQDFIHPQEILSTSQGSMQVLPNGHVLMGYGFNGVYTEFTAQGEALCDAFFEPANRFGSGDVQSYRNLKFNWTGIPLTTPEILVEGETLYMSWLGSTKIRSWLLQDSDAADGLFTSVQTTPKVGFETEFALKDGKRMRHYVRAIAVDEGGTQLSISNPVQIVDPNPEAIWGEDPNPAPPAEEASNHPEDDYANMKDDLEDVQILLVLGVLALISAVLVGFFMFGKRCLSFRHIRTGGGGGEKDWSPREDGLMRGAFDKVRSYIPSRSGRGGGWRDFSARRGLLASHHEREDSNGDTSTMEFGIDGEQERGR